MLHTKETRETCFKDFADNISIGLLLVDGKASCVLANNFWLQISGYTEKDTVGAGWIQALSLQSSQEFEKQLLFAQHAKCGFETEVQIVTPNGMVKWVDLRVDPFLPSVEADNEELQFVVAASEVTEKKGNELSLRKYEERYENIINRASDLVYEVSRNGRFSFANPAANKILGYTEKEIIGKFCLDLVPAYARRSVARFYLRQIRSLEQNTYNEVPIITKSGKKIWIGQNITLTIRDNEVVGIQGVARAITEQKLAERARSIQDSTVRILAESDSEDSAIGRILESFSSTIDYQVASWWRYQEGHNGLNCRIFWTEKHNKYQNFERINSVLSLYSGEDIPGYVLETRRSIWKPDLYTAQNFIREHPARECGLGSGFWVPVFLDDKIYGIFEFLFDRNEPADPDLLRLMMNVASQFGQFVKRKNAEAEVESEIARKEAILDSAMDCIISINHRGEIIDYNPAAQRTFGYTAEEVIGKRMGEVLLGDSIRQEHYERIEEYLRTGESSFMSTRREIVGKRKNGEEFPLEVAVTPIKFANRMPIFTSYLRDITERKNWEEALKTAVDSAEAASNAKSQFLAVMSHEIRTPLNAIIGLGEIAAGTDSDQERKELSLIIQQNSEFLLTLINDILDYSKIEADQITLENIEFSAIDVIDEIAEIFSLRAESKGIELVCSIDSKLPQTLIGDPSRLRQVIMNLVSNALKFTDEGVVFVGLELLKKRKAKVLVEFSVTDTGIGIPEEQRKAIFEKFNQADASTSRKYGGTGLGLSIAQSLVNLMGGQIEVESMTAGGSRFSFVVEFPVAKGSKAYSLPEELKNKRILVAERNDVSLKSVLNVFAQMDVKPFGTTSYNELLLVLLMRKFDLLIMDCEFGGDENPNVFSELRELMGEETKILALSIERNLSPDKSKYHSILHKPFRQKRLLGAALDALGINQNVVSDDVHVTNGGTIEKAARILLAEDNPANQDLAIRLLAKFPYEIEIANNGREAVRMSRERFYDLILMDIEMPEKDGFQATSEIRLQETTRRVPIVALTAHAISGYREKCLAAGMDDYLTKPLRRATLIQTIQAILSGKDAAEFEVQTDTEKSSNGKNVVLVDADIFDLAEKYLQNALQTVSELREDLKVSDFEKIRRIGHNFKGSGAGYGFDKISALGKQIEDFAKETDLEKISDIADSLDYYLRNVQIESTPIVSA
ncbi:MAG: PAS domain S-box protein [Pyrinomonadaceae bacterium]